MNIGQAGLELIKSFESLRLEAYPDPGTGGKPWTIGYGHIHNVHEGETCTEEDADRFLLDDLADAERCLEGCIQTLEQQQYDALVSLVFNIGCGNFRASTLLRKLKAGEFEAAADEFLRWNRANGKIMNGLTRRRQAERTLFLS